MRPARGMALVLVVGVLALLASTASLFAGLAQLERKASAHRVLVSRARLLSRSALEDALSRVDAGQDAVYGGEDWDGDGAAAPTPGVEASAQLFEPALCNVEDCPVRHALRPSYFLRQTSGLPDLRGVEGQGRGRTGRLGGGEFVARVSDQSGKLCVNGGVLGAGDADVDGIPDCRDPDAGWNGTMARVLDVLGSQPELVQPSLGQKVLAARPAGGYRTLEELESLTGTSGLEPYVCLRAWTDTRVIRPNACAQPMQNAISEIKKARAPLRLEAGGRPPVNLEAAPRPVLAALADGLSGWSWYHTFWPLSLKLPAASSQGFAQAVIDFRAGRDPTGCFAAAGIPPGPFRSWSRFGAFCDSLVPSVLGGGAPPMPEWGDLALADLLKSNFDPNSRISKEAPDQLLWRWIDKSDLETASTEGSLGPTGWFRVTGLGRVLSPEGRILAQAEASCEVEAFRLLRQSTQADFVGGRTDPSTYLSLSSSLGPRTYGGNAPWGLGHGLGAVTYPCGIPALPGNAAAQDGALGLATVDLDVPLPDGTEMRFLARFDDGYAAEVGPPSAPGPWSAKLCPNPSQGLWPDPPAEPGGFCPDGLHVQSERAPGYAAQGIFPASKSWTPGDLTPSNHGALCYWVKPKHRPGWAYEASLVRFSGGLSQCFAIAREGDNWGIHLESGAPPMDDSWDSERIAIENRDKYNTWMPGLRWHLVTALFDSDAAVCGADVAITSRGVTTSVPGFVTYDPFYSYTLPFEASVREDLEGPGAAFVLGMQDAMSGMVSLQWSNFDHLVDEFAVCDLGDKPARAMLLAAAWSSERWKDGRYYKGGDARFLSVPLSPLGAEPAKVLWAFWTEVLPSESRREAVNGLSSPSGYPRVIDTILDDDPAPVFRVGVDLLGPSAGLDSPPLRPLVQGAPVGLDLASFAYRVRFETSMEDALNYPLLETPFLDDLTIAWRPRSGARLVSWEGAE